MRKCSTQLTAIRTHLRANRDQNNWKMKNNSKRIVFILVVLAAKICSVWIVADYTTKKQVKKKTRKMLRMKKDLKHKYK